MKLAPSTGVFLALLFLVVGVMIGATLTRVVDRWPLDEVSAEDWFFVEVLGCKFPVPNVFTVNARAGSRITIRYDKPDAVIQQYYPSYITIRNIDGKYERYYSDELDFKYEPLRQQGDLTYELMTVNDKSVIYLIRSEKQMVLLMGGNREFADLMFDYCASHPIEEKSSANCESRDGYVYCD